MDLNALLKHNQALRNRHAGKRCFILATGPSVQSQDLSVLRDEVCIAVNSFYLHPSYAAIAPAYYVIADPDFWIKPEITLFPTLQAINEAGVATRFFAPSAGISTMQQINSGLMITPHFFHYGNEPTPLLDIDLARPIPPYGQNVVVVAIMLAFHLGCSSIYLLGCDHSWWTWSEDDYVREEYKHFYREPSHARTMQQDISFRDLQGTIVRQRYEYEKLRHYGNIKGCNIYNSTAGGCLDIFPRVPFDSLFARTRGSHKPLPAAYTSAQELAESAVSLINAHQVVPALVLLDRALAENTNRFAGMFGLEFLQARCLASLGLINEAIEALHEMAVKAPPLGDEACRLLSLLEEHLRTGDSPLLQQWLAEPASSQCLSLLNRLEKESPQQTKAYQSSLLQHGESLFSQGELHAAWRCFHDLLAIDPTNAPAHNNLGVIYWHFGRTDKALEHFSKALEADPNNRDAVMNSSEVLMSLGKHARAITLCESYLQGASDPEIEILVEQLIAMA